MNITNAKPSTNTGPTRVAIHGVEGSGKSTTSCYFPKPLIVGAENGIPRDLGFSVDTIAPSSWLDVFDVVGSLTKDWHDYETAVIDTVDWMEPLIHRFVCARDSKRQTEMNPKGRELESIEDYGFGKGYLAAEEEFRKLIGALDIMQAKRHIHVVLLLHSAVRTFKNPSGADFDRWEPKCHARISRVVVEYAENVLFTYFPMDASKISEDKDRHKMSPDRARAKGVMTGDRMVGCQQSAMYDAKNRVRLPPEMPMTDPNQLVSMLLGEHLADNQPIAERARGTYQQPQTVVETPPPQREQMRIVPSPVAERAPVQVADSAPVQQRQGIPAHHESRVEDERERQEDAFARARETVAERDAKRQVSGSSNEATKTDARTWTDPRTDPRTGDSPSTHKSVTTETDRMFAQLAETLNTAERIGGAKYRSTVNSWVSKAAGDPNKIGAIVRKVNDEAAKSTNHQPSA